MTSFKSLTTYQTQARKMIIPGQYEKEWIVQRDAVCSGEGGGHNRGCRGGMGGSGEHKTLMPRFQLQPASHNLAQIRLQST